MESIAALSLAGTVVQSVQLASSLMHTDVESQQSSAEPTSYVLTLDEVYEQLDTLTHNLAGCLDAWHGESAAGFAGFRGLSLLCKSDCERLLGFVSILKGHAEFRGRRWTRSALETICKERETAELEDRLKNTWETMRLHFKIIARYIDLLSVLNDRKG
jgi:hypothetical protein